MPMFGPSRSKAAIAVSAAEALAVTRGAGTSTPSVTVIIDLPVGNTAAVTSRHLIGFCIAQHSWCLSTAFVHF